MIGRGIPVVHLLVSRSALSGCIRMVIPLDATAQYDVALVEVERPTVIRERWGEPTQRAVTPRIA